SLINGELANDTYYMNTTAYNNHLTWFHGRTELQGQLDNALADGYYIKIYSSPDADLYKLS
ncbi:hypothetical protein KAR91_01010, partial [Candidatus Pacearchaeota archaeon]|nr:hypothetical protein [Candidatus Pacearchaeota archaeon]